MKKSTKMNIAIGITGGAATTGFTFLAHSALDTGIIFALFFAGFETALIGAMLQSMKEDDN